MVDFIQFVKEHPGIDVKIEYWHDHPRGTVITMSKKGRHFRFCLGDGLYFDMSYSTYPNTYIEALVNRDTYIETWLNNGLKELNKEDKNDQD